MANFANTEALMTDSIPWTAAVTFNAGYNTLTLSLPNPRAKTCGCGAAIPVGCGIALTDDTPYQARRAPRMCLRCAVKTIMATALPFRQLKRKDYPHFLDSCDGPLSQEAVARAFAAAYLRKFPEMSTPAWLAFALEGGACPDA